MRKLLKVLPYLILVIALTLLVRELGHLRWEEFKTTVFDYGAGVFAWGLGLLAINYVVWSAYDWTSLRQQKLSVPYVQIFRTTSVAFPITNLVGYSLITGFAARLRRYEPRGVTYAQITKLILFNISTWWIGFLFLCGAAIIHAPDGELFNTSDTAARWIGIGLLAIVAAYLIIAWRTRGREFRLGRVHLHFPDLESGLTKILVSVSDNLVVGMTLFIFLPSAHDVSFAKFMAYFLSATLVALLSFVPAGWGVLEGVLLYLFRPYASDAEIVAGMVMFRVFHYLIPMALAALYLGGRKLTAPTLRTG